MMVPNTMPVNWHPDWEGSCTECGVDQLKIVCEFDEQMNMAWYDLWAECAWCGKDYTLPTPQPECAY